MCIRDSPYTIYKRVCDVEMSDMLTNGLETNSHYLLMTETFTEPENTELMEVPYQDASSLVPVSYTHLDVYKRQNIKFAGTDIKSILITSCYPNEGKSDIAFSLAKEMASSGKKVLLLDADMRKSSYINRFRVEEEVIGLSQVLSRCV